MPKGRKQHKQGLRFRNIMCSCGYTCRGSPRNVRKLIDIHNKFKHPERGIVNDVDIKKVVNDVMITNNNNTKMLNNKTNNNDLVKKYKEKYLKKSII
jgi:hypothetical protein